MYKDITHHKTMTLTLEDDSLLELQPLILIEFEGKEYIALTSPDEKSEDVYFYEFSETGDNEAQFNNIEDERILEEVLNEFEKWIDEQPELEE